VEIWIFLKTHGIQTGPLLERSNPLDDFSTSQLQTPPLSLERSNPLDDFSTSQLQTPPLSRVNRCLSCKLQERYRRRPVPPLPSGKHDTIPAPTARPRSPPGHASAKRRCSLYLRPRLVINMLKFNSRHINITANAWSTKCRLIACMSTQLKSNLRDKSIKPN
jgi:hypothetical protein